MTAVTDHFAEGWPVAWTFHRCSSRWMYNAAVHDDQSFPQGSTLEYDDVEYSPLPIPELPTVPLDHVLRGRYSCRRFAQAAVPLAQLSNTLFAGYGVLSRTQLGPLEFLERAAPSAGGLCPLEIYVIVQNVDALAPGVYHYNSTTHSVALRRESAVPDLLLTYLFMGQTYAAAAGFVIVITGIPQRSFPKYGDRGYRYLLLEAGHVMQNLTLVAVAQGLGVCSLGGFFDDELGQLLHVDAAEQPLLYCLAVGNQEAGHRDHLRLFTLEEAPITGCTVPPPEPERSCRSQ